MSKIALITGATAGFGTAICRTLIQAGYFVIGTGRRSKRLASLKAELGEKFLPLAFDISDRLATQEQLHLYLHNGKILIYSLITQDWLLA